MKAKSEELRTEIRNQALAYYKRGWTVIPIDTSCGRKKPPRGTGWRKYQNQRPSEAEFAEMFGASSDFNGVAVILGNASGGLACRDFDNDAAYADWAKSHPALAESLPTVRTGKGFHVYFRVEKEGYKEFPDGEYRADSRHYCLLPPSRHPCGSSYSWLIPLQDELPVLDPRKAGLCSPEATPETQQTQKTQKTQTHTPPSSPSPPCPELSELSGSSASHGPFEPEVERAIAQTLPDRAGVRNRCLFDFAREMQRVPAYTDSDSRSLEPIVREWHRRALPVIRTKPFEETWIDWLKAWPKVKWPAGKGPLDEVFRRSLHNPLPDTALRYEQRELRQLVAFTAELQRSAGDRPFFLSCRSAARLLGVSKATASRWLFVLVQDRALEEVLKGDWETKKASEYLYLLDLPPGQP